MLRRASALLRRPFDRLGRLVRRPFAFAGDELAKLGPFERVFYSGLLLTGCGLALVWLPLGLIVPGSELTIVAFIFKLRKA